MEHRRAEIDQAIKTMKGFLRKDREFFPTKFNEFCQSALTFINGLDKEESVKKSILFITPEHKDQKNEIMYEPFFPKDDISDVVSN